MLSGKNVPKFIALIVLFLALLPAIAPMSAQAAACSRETVLINSTADPKAYAAAWSAANQYSVPFDHNVWISSIITTDEGRYYVVEYENYLPLAGGIEVLAENGTKVTNSSQAKAVLRSVAWSESIRSINETDIATLEIIQNNTKNIRNTVIPLTNLSNQLIDTCNLKRDLNRYGITNEFAIGLITGSVNSTNAGYEGAVILINNLNNQLNDFSNASVEVNDRLPGIISGAKEIKGGTGYADEELQADIIRTAADLSLMQEKVGTVRSALEDMSGVGDFLATVQAMATGLLAYVPLIGDTLKDFANYLLSITGDYLANVLNLKAYAQALQDNLRLEQQKLNAVISQADQQTTALTGSWNARQTAWAKVWIYATGSILLILAALATLILAFLYPRKILGFLKPKQEGKKK